MKFTPKYTVSYHGVFHRAGVPFEIDAKDETEMRRHGTVETYEHEHEAAPELIPEPEPKRRGRPPKKNN